jgi:hypothetical protein
LRRAIVNPFSQPGGFPLWDIVGAAAHTNTFLLNPTGKKKCSLTRRAPDAWSARQE